MAGIGAALPAIGSAVGIGSALGGLFGGAPASNVQLPNMFQMPNMTGAANNAFSGIGGLQNYSGAAFPQFQQDVSQFYQNNPFMGQAIGGAQNAAAAGQGVGLQALGAGNQFTGAGTSMIPYTTSILNTAFDPQQALYGRTQQQVQDQTRAALAASGLQGTPYGAGVEGQTMSNFNIDWQNNLLNRMTQGAQGAGGLLGAAGGAATTGNQLGQSGYGTLGQAAALPYQTYTGIGNDQLNSLNQLMSAGQVANATPQQQIQDYFGYLGAGNQAGGVANQLGQLGLNQANAGFAQNQVLGQNLGTSLSGLGNALGKMYGSSGGWGGQPTNIAYSGTLGGTGGSLGGLY